MLVNISNNGEVRTQFLGSEKPNFNVSLNPNVRVYEIPCGHCIECRINSSAEWATRSVLEAKQWPHNWFVTLTYDDEHIHKINTISRFTGKIGLHSNLVYDDIQRFLKRLRKYFDEEFNHVGIRFLCSGEYGELTHRSHWHLLLFNYPHPQNELHVRNIKDGHIYFDSPLLKKLWPLGNNLLTDLNYCTSEYVAKYALKKMYGHSESQYIYDCLRLGLEPQTPELLRMSRKPGIAFNYYKDKLSINDFLYLNNILLSNGKYSVIPKYFKRLLKERPELISDARIFDECSLSASDVLEVYSSTASQHSKAIEDQILKNTSLTKEVYADNQHKDLLMNLKKRDFEKKFTICS